MINKATISKLMTSAMFSNTYYTSGTTAATLLTASFISLCNGHKKAAIDLTLTAIGSLAITQISSKITEEYLKRRFDQAVNAHKKLDLHPGKDTFAAYKVAMAEATENLKNDFYQAIAKKDKTLAKIQVSSLISHYSTEEFTDKNDSIINSAIKLLQSEYQRGGTKSSQGTVNLRTLETCTSVRDAADSIMQLAKSLDFEKSEIQRLSDLRDELNAEIEAVTVNFNLALYSVEIAVSKNLELAK